MLKPKSFVTAKSLSTTRFHKRIDKTLCGHPPVTLAVKLLPIKEVCTSLLPSMDLTHQQQVSSSPPSLAAVVIALKDVLSNAPQYPGRHPTQSPSDSRTFPVCEQPGRELFL
jgi:hypothetical protein